MRRFFAVTLTMLVAIGCFLLSACGDESDFVSRNLTKYEIAATIDDELMEVSARQTVSYINSADNVLAEVCFNLHARGYREGAEFSAVSAEDVRAAYPNGMSYGDIEIISVKVDDVDIKFEIRGADNNMLYVPLNSILYPDERVNIYIEYKIKLANVKHRLGYTENAINLGNWYPIACVFEGGMFKNYPYYSMGDPFYSEVANYDVTVTIPSGYVVAAGGELKNKVLKGDMTTYKYTNECIRDFALVASKKFKVERAKSEGVDISYYYFDDLNPIQSVKTAKQSIKTFNNAFGKYTCDTLAVVQTDFLEGGMEYPALVYIGADVKGQSYLDVIVHEIAHQWWYSAVGNNQVEDAWIDEGLAEFSTAYFYEKNTDYGNNGEFYLNRSLTAYRSYLQLTDDFNITADTCMQKHLGDFKSDSEYVAMVYNKGAILFNDLRRDMGEERFMESIKAFYAANKYKNVKKENLIGAIERCVNVRYESYIEGYLLGEVKI